MKPAKTLHKTSINVQWFVLFTPHSGRRFYWRCTAVVYVFDYPWQGLCLPLCFDSPCHGKRAGRVETQPVGYYSTACPGAMPRRWDPQTRYTLPCNKASIMKDLIWFDNTMVMLASCLADTLACQFHSLYQIIIFKANFVDPFPSFSFTIVRFRWFVGSCWSVAQQSFQGL